MTYEALLSFFMHHLAVVSDARLDDPKGRESLSKHLAGNLYMVLEAEKKGEK